MDISYDIFEILPDGTPMWRDTVVGREPALQRLDSLAEKCENEMRVVHLRTNVLLASKPRKG
jgi:hypothetical protein